MKRFAAALVLALVPGCSMDGRVVFSPDDSRAATAVGPGQFQFEGGHRRDTCTPGRAAFISAQDDLVEFHRRQVLLRAERDAARP